jgi:hypothetical protein
MRVLLEKNWFYILCEFGVSQGGKYEGQANNVLSCDAMQPERISLTFRRNALPSSSGSKITPSNKRAASVPLCLLLPAYCLAHFISEDGGNAFLRNMSKLSLHYNSVLYFPLVFTREALI